MKKLHVTLNLAWGNSHSFKNFFTSFLQQKKYFSSRGGHNHYDTHTWFFIDRKKDSYFLATHKDIPFLKCKSKVFFIK